MRDVDVSEITKAVCEMCILSNYNLNSDIRQALQGRLECEESDTARAILCDILRNSDIARAEEMPICQDTGMAIIFIKVGQEVHLCGGNLTDAINEGVRLGYEKGYLRKSVVKDPVRRGNTGDNTPAVIHTEIIDGDKIEITVAPKGFGSENMSAIKMLKPSDGADGIIKFVTDTVRAAGSNPCPPVVVGIGIGGSFEKAALLAKTALLRNIDTTNPDEYYANMEAEILDKINATGIGPQGLGGKTTALGVNIEVFPTHIAGMPCAVNISCHVTRHLKRII